MRAWRECLIDIFQYSAADGNRHGACEWSLTRIVLAEFGNVMCGGLLPRWVSRKSLLALRHWLIGFFLIVRTNFF